MRYVQQIVTDRSPQATVFRWVAILVTIAIITLCLTMPALAQTRYVITDGDNVIVCMSSSTDPAVVIQEAGLQLGESDTYTTQTNQGVSEITINRVQLVTVREGSETIVVGTYGGTAADVLDSLDITLSDTDKLSCPLDAATYDGMTILISRRHSEILEYEEIIPHEDQILEDPSLAPGEEVVLIQGTDGLRRIRAQITYENEQEADRAILSEELIVAPVDGMILRGVDRSVKTQEHSGNADYCQSDTSTREDFTHGADGVTYVPGTNIPYLDMLDFQATAYFCPNPDWWNTTYTGTAAQVGTVAVDPNFIPLGTKMYIVSEDGTYVYGYAVAEDIGGAIKGKIVDLYFNTYDECIQFGRRNVQIYVLEWP